MDSRPASMPGALSLPLCGGGRGGGDYDRPTFLVSVFGLSPVRAAFTVP